MVEDYNYMAEDYDYQKLRADFATGVYNVPNVNYWTTKALNAFPLNGPDIADATAKSPRDDDGADGIPASYRDIDQATGIMIHYTDKCHRYKLRHR